MAFWICLWAVQSATAAVMLSFLFAPASFLLYTIELVRAILTTV